MNRIKNNDLSDEHFICREEDGQTLYLPSHSNAVGNAGWNAKNVWFRSRIEDKDGRTVSQGFPKFFNLGQGNDELRIDVADIIHQITHGDGVVATLKYDGSCLIRYVYNGEVKFRTRGSFDYRFHDNAEIELEMFRNRYPKLFDPTFMPNVSMLFEWVTPDAQIVIKYHEPDLILIGMVAHSHRHLDHLRMMPMASLSMIGESAGVRVVEYFEIKNVEGWYYFYHQVIQHREIEGYVIRFGDHHEKLVKIKANPYITKHGLKSNLSFKSMVEFWLQHGAGQGETVVKQLEALYDEEVVMWALPFVIKLEDAVTEWEKTLDYMRHHARERQHWPRKDYAIYSQKQFAHDRILFGIAMVLFEDLDAVIDNKTIRKYMERFNDGQGHQD